MLERLSGETRLFPIVGDPIIYVKSPERLTSGFAARGHNGICVPMQVPEGALESVMHGLTRIRNIDGLLVTCRINLLPIPTARPAPSGRGS